MFLSFITGHFKNLFYFTLIILIHEIGHFITGKVMGFKLDKIEIYPYGGCSKLVYDINVDFIKEFLVLVMGPLFQISFMLIIYYFKFDVPNYFYTYNKFILIFNLLPIYPLDGGRLLHLLFSYCFSYYNSLKTIIYISYFIFINIFLYLILFNRNLVFILIILLLGKQIFKEIREVDYYYQKFLLERYLNDYIFRKVKRIRLLKQMNRYSYHLFIDGSRVINEKGMINDYFKGLRC